MSIPIESTFILSKADAKEPIEYPLARSTWTYKRPPADGDIMYSPFYFVSFSLLYVDIEEWSTLQAPTRIVRKRRRVRPFYSNAKWLIVNRPPPPPPPLVFFLFSYSWNTQEYARNAKRGGGGGIIKSWLENMIKRIFLFFRSLFLLGMACWSLLKWAVHRSLVA